MPTEKNLGPTTSHYCMKRAIYRSIYKITYLFHISTKITKNSKNVGIIIIDI